MKSIPILLIALVTATSAIAEKARVIILTGANNHNWKATTPELKGILEGSGEFAVEVVTEPEELTRERLSRCDVLLSNWNAFGKKKPAPWSDALRSAYIDFVRKGGGHVVAHAGSSSFYEWDDYHSICCATWKDDTGHKGVHEFEVRAVNHEHAVTRGFGKTLTTDELWFRPFVQPKAEVLAESFSRTTGKWEPTAMVGQFGKGRCFTLLLGHDVNGMGNDAFKKLLVRGTAWAAGKIGDVQITENSVSRSSKGQTLWTLNHDADEGKPCIHPLAAVGGKVLSGLRPDDHPWHRALWFSWKFINGVNYWEENRVTGKSAGRTSLLDTRRTELPGGVVRVEMDLTYAPAATGDRILDEFRTLEIHPLDADGAYRIDWSSRFLALKNDVILDRTPPPGEPGGKDWGGYAGYSLRMNREVAGGVFANSEGQTGSATHRQPARWLSYSKPGVGAVLFLDHPTNLRHPAKWYVAEGMPYFSPSVIHDAPHTIKAGDTLRLQYRLVIQPSAVESDFAEQEWKRWTRPDASDHGG